MNDGETAVREARPEPGARELSESERRTLLEDVRRGLGKPHKELLPKYFYDHRGSQLFEEITTLPEYYLTRTETRLLQERVPGWLGALHPGTLVELGAGSARKTRILLDAIGGTGSRRLYVPVDVSGEFLEAAAGHVRAEYPDIEVRPRVADIRSRLALPPARPRPTLFALIGSTIGNFPEAEAVSLLRGVRDAMEPEDAFLLGADRRAGPHKPKRVLEAAYNDARGVTAEFNRNVLRVLNRELAADFDLDAFEHLAFYDDAKGRIEMHLRSLRDQTVHVPGMPPVQLGAGETIRTELSCKYDRDTLDDLFGRAGLAIVRWAGDPERLYALVLGRRVG